MEHPNVYLVTDYATALRHFEHTEPWRNRPDDPRPAIKRNSRYTVDVLEDDAVQFCNYATPAVTFYPDGLITLHGESSYSNGTISQAVTPRGICPLTRRGFVGLHDQTTPYLWGEGRWERVNGTRKYVHRPNPNARMARVSPNTPPVKLRLEGYNWVIQNEAELAPIEWHSPDRKLTRQLCADSGLTDFLAWFSMVTTLDEGLTLPEHSYEDMDSLLGALAERRFADACMFLPIKYWYRWRGGNDPIQKRAALHRIRPELYRRHPEVLKRNTRQTVTLGEYHTARSYQFEYADHRIGR